MKMKAIGLGLLLAAMQTHAMDENSVVREQVEKSVKDYLLKIDKRHMSQKEIQNLYEDLVKFHLYNYFKERQREEHRQSTRGNCKL